MEGGPATRADGSCGRKASFAMKIYCTYLFQKNLNI